MHSPFTWKTPNNNLFIIKDRWESSSPWRTASVKQPTSHKVSFSPRLQSTRPGAPSWPNEVLCPACRFSRVFLQRFSKLIKICQTLMTFASRFTSCRWPNCLYFDFGVSKAGQPTRSEAPRICSRAKPTQCCHLLHRWLSHAWTWIAATRM